MHVPHHSSSSTHGRGCWPLPDSARARGTGGGRGGAGGRAGDGAGGGEGLPGGGLAMGELPLELDAVMVELASGSGEHELGLDAAAMALHDHDEVRGTAQAGSDVQVKAVI